MKRLGGTSGRMEGTRVIWASDSELVASGVRAGRVSDTSSARLLHWQQLAPLLQHDGGQNMKIMFTVSPWLSLFPWNPIVRESHRGDLWISTILSESLAWWSYYYRTLIPTLMGLRRRRHRCHHLLMFVIIVSPSLPGPCITRVPYVNHYW